ncbi:MAG: site-2 protease family protein, partial [Prevotella sp.]|nr:site-2 protease family protein [Prevotella sp.]
YAEVLRNGKKVRIAMPGDLNLLDMVKVTPPFTRPFIPAVVDSVLKQIPSPENSNELVETPAYKIGLQKGDRILAVNGQAIDSYNEFTEEIGRVGDQLMSAKNKRDSLKLLNVNLVVQRANTNLKDTLNAMLTPDLKLGFSVADVARLYESRVTHDNYSLLESFPAGAKYGWNVLSGYVNDMKYLFSANGAKNLGGFVTIGSMFPAQWDWFLFWKMTAFFSIILAFMNILPIPALDGGHVLFLLYEIIARRKPSETFMIRAEYVGLTIIILLMLVANLNDILSVLGIM